MEADLIPPGAEISSPPLDATPATSANGAEPAVKPAAGKKKRRRILHMKLPGMGELSTAQLWRLSLEWLSNPVNAAAFLWCILASVAFVVLMACEAGMVHLILHDEGGHVEEELKESSIQILNALFVLMCLVWHPVFMRDVLLLARWRPKDKWEIRAEYCKGGKRKPHDWTHMVVTEAGRQGGAVQLGFGATRLAISHCRNAHLVFVWGESKLPNKE